MKAKEYFNSYKNDYPGKSNDYKVIAIFRQIFIESRELAVKRNVQFDSAYQTIFREANDKANSFCKMVNDTDDMQLKHNAFMYFIRGEVSQNIFELLYPNAQIN